MELSVTRINQAVSTYQKQNKIADLNKNRPVKVVQGQVDTVTLSTKAKQLAANPPAES